MGLMKKLFMRGVKPRKLRTVCPCQSGCRVRQKPVQMDLFEGNWFYHERKLLYVSQTEDVSARES